MHVFFDFELDDNVEQPADPNNLVYVELKKFFISRYKVLDDKINACQSEQEMSFVALIMHENGLEVKYFNIPAELLQKVKDCVTEDDYSYMVDNIWYKIQDFKNKGR